jgi:hypothetical protein
MFAQNLEDKIPSNAKAVISANGDRIFELLPMSVLNQSDLMQKMFKKAKVQKLEDFGIDIKQKAYYFYQVFDGKQYHNFLIKLSDKSKYENHLSEYQKNKIQKTAGNSYIFNNEFTTAWNDNLLVISIIVKQKKDQYSSNNNYYNTEETDEEAEIEEEVLGISEPETNAATKEKVKKQIENSKYITALLTESVSNPISNNDSYTSGKDSKSAGYVWIANYGEIIDDITKMTQSPYSAYSKMNISYKQIVGINAVKANLFFDKDEIKIKSEFNLNDYMAGKAKKMYDSKLSRNFYKYFDQKNTLAYISSSVNMEEMLKIYPEMFAQTYSSILPKYKDEISAVADIISTVLDEKAMAEVITGDFLLLLNGIEEQEVTYTSYKYDENYKRTKVTKTKKETLPVFTVMLGSENSKIINKLMRLGLKHQLANEAGNIFTFDKKMTKIPFDLFFIVQDDIAFLTNSKSQITKIATKAIDSDLGKHKRFFKKNIATVYVNSEKILAQFPKDKIGEKGSKLANLVQKNIKESLITFSRLKRNKMFAEYKIKTADTHKNSLRLLFDMIEGFNKR